MAEDQLEVSADVAAQALELRRGTLQIVPENGLEAKLTRSKRTGRPLRIKLGLDPTAPDIHLGFAVVLRKLRQFQDLGHEVVIIIGDYTALIGDPSGRSSTRPMLTSAEIEANGANYVEQLARILDPGRTVVRFNSEWLGKLNFAEVVRLASKMTVAQVLQREDFANRFAQHLPLSLHELLYPLAQAFDSVAIEADIEMGGQDQMFNILAGRDLQREEGQEPQVALFMPLLVGLDGVKKMSKSLGNYVGIAESPDTMFGKLMSITDDLLETYLDLCTDVPPPAARHLMWLAGLHASEQISNESEQDVTRLIGADDVEMYRNPKNLKRLLARQVVGIYHGAGAALTADAEWQRIHAQHQLPTDIADAEIDGSAATDGKLWVCRLLVEAGMAKGTGEARRLVEQGGVTLDGKKLADTKLELEIIGLHGRILKVGARRFVRLRVTKM